MPEAPDNRGEMPFLDHLEELRWRILYSLLAIVLGTLAAVWFLVFWAGIPFYRHNWIDEDAEEEDERASDGETG